jgi:hypothetical protein
MRNVFGNEHGSGTVAAAIGAFATLGAAFIAGFFLLASARTGPPGPTSTVPTTAPNSSGIDDGLDDLFDELSASTAVYLSLDNGPTGSTVRVSGEGFQADERIVLRFHTDQIGTTQANNVGGFSNVSVEIPPGYANFAPHQFSLVATGQSSAKSASAPFTLTG